MLHQVVGYIVKGDWIKFAGMNLVDITTATFRVSSGVCPRGALLNNQTGFKCWTSPRCLLHKTTLLLPNDG